MWDWFVNTHGRAGRNIPCDIYNEHVQLLKHIIVTMGANLTEKALHRAAQSVPTLCKRFDQQSGVPVGTHAHSSLSDKQDITKVVNTILRRELLEIFPGTTHSTFKRMRLNPLWNWDVSKTSEWIEKKKDFIMFRGAMRREDSEDSSCDDDISEYED